jgi:hypothetical protein
MSVSPVKGYLIKNDILIIPHNERSDKGYWYREWGEGTLSVRGNTSLS